MLRVCTAAAGPAGVACLSAQQVIHCIENGLPLLIENLPEEIDPVLDAVIQKKVGGAGGEIELRRCPRACIALFAQQPASRPAGKLRRSHGGCRRLASMRAAPSHACRCLQVMKRGRSLILKLGDAEVEYDPRFRLYLHTKLRWVGGWMRWAGVGCCGMGLAGSFCFVCGFVR